MYLIAIYRAPLQLPYVRRIPSMSNRIAGNDSRLQHKSSSGHFMQLSLSSGLSQFRHWLPSGGQRGCNVPSHPEFLCNMPKHSDYPKHASRCPPPEIEPICNIDLPKGHPRVICNFIRHPHYPKYCNPKATGQQPNTVCNVPGHVLDKCNIPEHPDFPDFKAKKPPVQIEGNINTPTPNDDLPLCTVPGHPMLLCNVRVHPDYPKFTHPELPEFSEAVAGLVCTIPSHQHGRSPMPSKCNM
jgi:hypothetical protein